MNIPLAHDAIDLADLLEDVERCDTRYDDRYPLVFHALSVALRCGYPAGIRIDPTEPEWPVAYIELPTGQVSWHMPTHPVAFDGHDTEQKYERCRAYTIGVRA